MPSSTGSLLCAISYRAQPQFMMNFPTPASAPSDRTACADPLRLAVAAYLARFKGSSRKHTESDLRCFLTWCAEEVRHAIAGPVSTVVDIVKTTLDKCPPELSGDVMDRGIALTGGGALLRGLDERLREETGMPIQLADNPLESVVLGTGKCVEDFDALQQVLVPERRR